MNKILDWKQIQKEYQHQWVQLVDYDWPDGEPHPKSGKVRINATTRKEFNKLVLQAEPRDAARIYVGDHSTPEGTVISSNITRIVP
jgi:hypothetical protein